jgi:hypothetical protein
MDALFSEFSIKALTLPNRIVMPSVASFLIGTDGSISTRAVEHYRRRAAGGPAMVIIEACAVSPEGIVSPNQARIHHDRFIAGLAEIAAAIRSEGSVPAVQLHHGGRQTPARVIKQKPVAPSALPCPTIRGDVQPLGIEGIRSLVEMLPRLGAGMEAMTRKLLLKRLKVLDARLLTECRLEKVAPDGVWITDGDARQRMLPADKVLIAVGTRADNRLYQEIRDIGCEVYQIGDCRTPQDAKAAIYEGAVLGRQI